MNEILITLKEPLNLGFTIAMLIIFLYSIYSIKKDPKRENTSISTVAALGIIGTFAGILVGLLKFNSAPDKMEASITGLLEGMKTAFVTSVIGLTLSTILKMIKSYLLKNYEKNKGIEGTDLDKIVSLIEAMKESQEMGTKKNNELMERLEKSIILSNEKLIKEVIFLKDSQIEVAERNEKMTKNALNSLIGEGELTLTSQMKFMRKELVNSQEKSYMQLKNGLESMTVSLKNLVGSNNAISEEIEKGNKELIFEFREFSKKMAENNMKAFVQAIQDCIKDLNNQLTEQFGDNFKHLNNAVEKLLDWQVHYKETVEKTNEVQIELYKGIEEARNSLIKISEKTLTIVDVANRLGELIVTFDTQEQKLNNSIEILNKTSEKAESFLPNIENLLSKSSNSIEHFIKENTDKLVMECMNMGNQFKEVSDLVSLSTIQVKEFNESTLGNLKEVNENIVKDTIAVITETSKAGTENIQLKYTEVSDLVSLSTIQVKEFNESTLGNLKEVNENIVKDTIAVITETSKAGTENIQLKYTEVSDLISLSTIQVKEFNESTLGNLKEVNENIVKDTIAVITETSKIGRESLENKAKESSDYLLSSSDKIIDFNKNILDSLKENSLIMVDNTLNNITTVSKLGIESIEEEFKEMSKNLTNSSFEITSFTETTTNELKKYLMEITMKRIDEIKEFGNKVTEVLSQEMQDINRGHKQTNEKIQNTISEMEKLRKLFENDLYGLIENLGDAKEEIIELSNVNISSIKSFGEKILGEFLVTSENINSAGKENVNSINKQINVISSMTSRLENDGIVITKRVSDNIQTMVENNNKNLRNSVDNLNKQLEATLNLSLESLGNQLAAVSEKFVSDYTPLTRELKNLVEISKRVGR